MPFRKQLLNIFGFSLILVFGIFVLGTSAASAQEEQICFDDSVCGEGRFCNPAGICEDNPEPVVVGTECSADPYICQSAGFTCDEGTSPPSCRLPAGSTCSATRFCETSTSCVNNKCEYDTGGEGGGGGGTPNSPGGGGGGGAGGGSRPPRTGGGGSVNLDCPDNLPVNVNGVCLPEGAQCSDDSLLCANSLSDLIVKIIKLLLGLAAVIGVLILVIGGYWYVASAGNEETAEKGKKTIINAIIGLVVIILAYTIVSIIANTLTT